MENMNIYYDDEGDYLEITVGDISNCYFNNMANGIFQIIDKKTKEIKGVAIHSFRARTKNLDEGDILWGLKAPASTASNPPLSK